MLTCECKHAMIYIKKRGDMVFNKYSAFAYFSYYCSYICTVLFKSYKGLGHRNITQSLAHCVLEITIYN